jgi:hypothetical protein
MQDNDIKAYATDFNPSEDYMQDGVQTLGYYGFRYFQSLGYDLNITLTSFLLRGTDIEGSLSLPGWKNDGSNDINNSGLYTFTGIDIHTLTTLFTVIGAAYAGSDLTVAQGSLMTRGSRWRGRMLLPGLQTS